MRTKKRNVGWFLAALVSLPILALSLTAQQTTSLAISGQPGRAKVIQVEGQYYVSIDDLARITNGSLSFKGPQIVLALPGSIEETPAPAAPAEGFSKEFLGAAIEAMSQAREWHAALKNAIERGYPLSEDWLGPFRRQTQQDVRLAMGAAHTDTDKNLGPILNNVFRNMSALTDQYLQMTRNRNYIAPNSLDSDPLDQRLVACGHALVSMVGSNQFVEESSCR